MRPDRKEREEKEREVEMEGPWVKYFFEITSKEEEEEEELYLLIPSLPPSILEFYFFSLPLSLSTSSTTCFRFPLPISLSTYLSLYLSLSTSLFLPLFLPSLHSYHQFSFFFSSPFPKLFHHTDIMTQHNIELLSIQMSNMSPN